MSPELAGGFLTTGPPEKFFEHLKFSACDICALVLLAKASNVIDHDQPQEGGEGHVHCVPVLRTGDNQRRALPGNEKGRRGSKETNLTTR